MTCTVLIVDDDPDISTLLDDVLRARGMRVLTAHNGADAIEVCRAANAKPAVIVLDMMMPVMDGATFLEIQPTISFLAGVPVIVMTATPPTGPLPSTVRTVLAKPVLLGTLLPVVQEACSGLDRGGEPVRTR